MLVGKRFLALVCVATLWVAMPPSVLHASPGALPAREAQIQPPPSFILQPQAPANTSKSELVLPAATPQTSRPEPFVESAPQPVPPFPILLNRAVRHYVAEFLDQPDGLKLAFQRSRPFLANMMSVLQARGLPADLVYLAFAESEFTKGGKGPWQFTKCTARRLGLHINQWVDERRDPIRATRAAAEYLAELHDEADNDWRMTVVGWNLGQGSIDQYWLLQGSAANYEKFERYLPRRTRQLLCRFMAVAFIAHSATAYGIEPAGYLALPTYQTRRFAGGTLLWKIAAKYRTTVSKLRTLNPELLKNRIPPYVHSYKIRLPVRRVAQAGRRL